MCFLKKAALLLSLVFAASSGASAQTSQIATLLHDGVVTSFYSSSAFSKALEAAVDGDIISLSGGMFTASDITKNVTIRGAGMGAVNGENNTIPTTISGNFTINCPVSETYHLTIEGIANNSRVTIENADNLSLTKCRFSGQIYNTGWYGWNNFNILHCVITNLYFPDDCTMNLINSVITKNISTNSTGSGNYGLNISNSVIYRESDMANSDCTNSIIVMTKKSNGETGQITGTTSLHNCVVMGASRIYADFKGNKLLLDSEPLFAETGFYELAPELKEFKGTDGLEVGIHGGSMPFDTALNIPVISKFQVSSKTTADGKLSVDIEVKGVDAE